MEVKLDFIDDEMKNFILKTGKYKIVNDIRVTEVETFYHEGTLIEKTL